MRSARRRVGSCGGSGVGVVGVGSVGCWMGVGVVGVEVVVVGVGWVCGSLVVSFLSSASISSSRFFSKIFSFFLRKLNIGHPRGEIQRGLFFFRGVVGFPSFVGFYR